MLFQVSCLLIFFKKINEFIFQLDEFIKLSSNTNLSLLDIRDNPCCRLNHLESFVVFHIRSLNTINGKVVSSDMRNTAVQRFSKGRLISCLLYTSPSPRDKRQSRMPSSA